MFMPDESCMHSRAGTMINGKICHLRISAKEIELLLVYHQLLDQLRVLHHVQVEAHGWFARPGWRIIASIGHHSSLGGFCGCGGHLGKSKIKTDKIVIVSVNIN